MNDLPSATEYMKRKGIKPLNTMSLDYVGRWVSLEEALPPERLGVLVARNDLDGPEFAYLRYAAGDKDSPFFVCAGFAGLESRGVMHRDYGTDLVAVTHWYSPSIEGLPIVTRGLHSRVGLGSTFADYSPKFYDTTEYTREENDKTVFAHLMRDREKNGLPPSPTPTSVDQESQ